MAMTGTNHHDPGMKKKKEEKRNGEDPIVSALQIYIVVLSVVLLLFLVCSREYLGQCCYQEPSSPNELKADLDKKNHDRPSASYIRLLEICYTMEDMLITLTKA